MRTHSGRGSVDGIMQTKKVASGGKRKKQEKSRSGLSVCTMTEQCTAVLVSKAHEAALYKDGIFTSIKPSGLCLLPGQAHMNGLSTAGRTPGHGGVCVSLQLQPCGCPGPCHFCSKLPQGCFLCLTVPLYWGMHLKHLKQGPGVHRTHTLLFLCTNRARLTTSTTQHCNSMYFTSALSKNYSPLCTVSWAFFQKPPTQLMP